MSKSNEKKALLLAWKQVFNTDTVNDADNFFELGGTSLMAIQVESILFDQGFALSAADIFENPVLSDLVPLILLADEIDWED